MHRSSGVHCAWPPATLPPRHSAVGSSHQRFQSTGVPLFPRAAATGPKAEAGRDAARTVTPPPSCAPIAQSTREPTSRMEDDPMMATARWSECRSESCSLRPLSALRCGLLTLSGLLRDLFAPARSSRPSSLAVPRWVAARHPAQQHSQKQRTSQQPHRTHTQQTRQREPATMQPPPPPDPRSLASPSR